MENETDLKQGFKLTKKTLISLISVIVLIVSIIIGTNLVQIQQIFRSRANEAPPGRTPQSSFSLQAEKTAVAVNQSFKVRLLARSDIDTANLFSARISFPSDVLELTSIDPKDGVSFIRSWVEKSFQNDVNPGSIRLTGVVPAHGYKSDMNQEAGLMAELVFKAKKEGPANIIFRDQESAIYRNSDNQNILNNTSPVLVSVAAPTPAPLSQGTFILRPRTDTVRKGETVSVTVLAKSDQEAANLFSLKLNFPNDLLRVERIDPKDGVSFIRSWVEKSFQNDVNPGLIRITGGVADPGYQSRSNADSIMAEIVFSARKEGRAILQIASDSGIYRNSDNVNIFQNSSQTAINIVAGQPVPSATVFPTQTPMPTLTPILTATLTPVVSVQITLPRLQGDIDGNGKIDLVDLSVFMSRWGTDSSRIGSADLNSDGVLNSVDFSLMRSILVGRGVIRE